MTRCRRHALTSCEECHGANDSPRLSAQELSDLAFWRSCNPNIAAAYKINRMLDHIAAAEAALAACEQDSKRLDWLLENAYCDAWSKERQQDVIINDRAAIDTLRAPRP